MIAMLDNSADHKKCSEELGCPVEQLLTPRSRFTLRSEWFAIDNGAFSGFDATSFFSLLKREDGNQSRCRFVAVPDVVGSALRTKELFDHFKYLLGNWPLAFVAQDGQESLPIPWDNVAAVFIGGSTEWKMSIHAERIIRTAKALGKWAHIGRVNTPGRFEDCELMGADSIDGQGISQYTHMRKDIWDAYNQPQLFPKANGRNGKVVSGNTSGLERPEAALVQDRENVEGQRGQAV